MVMRETISGEAQACREKALRHIENIKATFKASTTDEEKFETFLGKFRLVAAGVERCRENFKDDNYTRWLDDPKTAAILHTGNQEGILLMEMLREEMEPLMSATEHKPLSCVNGTSVAFAQCSRECADVKIDFADTDSKFHEKIICNRVPESTNPIFVRKLEAIIAMIVAQFIFVPEGLLS